MSSRARIGIVVGAVVVLVIAFIIANGSGSDDKDKTTATAPAATPSATDGAAPSGTVTAKATPAIRTINVVDGKPQKGIIQKLTFTKGDTIRFKVQSDTADEIHFHGYDVHKDVTAGGSVTFAVPAKIEGRFVVELEGAGVQIAEVEVDPS